MPDNERLNEVEENEYKYLGILEYNKINESEMKENIGREYLRRTKLIMKNRLYGRDKITINTWAVSLIDMAGNIIDLYWVQLSNAVLFAKIMQSFIFIQNTQKRDWKRGRGWNVWGTFFKKVPFFHKRVPFLANVERCSKFLEYVLHGAGIVKLAKR